MARRSVDEHVVEMRFNNSDFEKKAQQSMSTLDKLKEKLNLNTSNKGVDNLASKLKNLNNTNLDGINNSIKVLDVSLKAIAKNKVFDILVDGALNAAKKVTSALTAPINQIVEGGKRRAKNIENAKFQLKGLGIEWTKIEDDINFGVKDTAYGLDEAAKAASQFVASGVQMGEEMQKALRGISGVAAMTNSSYSEIADIFTTVSGQGKLMTMQMNQLAGRGLNVAATLAKALGKTEAELREMVSKGQVDFKTFAYAMDDAFGEHAKKANETFDGALSNTKAALSRTGAWIATAGFEGLRRVLVATIPVLNQMNNTLKPIIGENGIIHTGLLKVADVAALGISHFEAILKDPALIDFFTTVGQVVDRVFVVAAEKVEKGFDIIERGIRNFIKGEGFAKIVELLYNVSQAILQPLRFIKYGFMDAFREEGLANITSFVDALSEFAKKLWLSADAQSGLRKVSYGLTKVTIWLIKKIGEFIKFASPLLIVIRNIIDSILSFVFNPRLDGQTFLDKIFKNEILQTLKTEWPKVIDNFKKKIVGFWSNIKKIFTKIKESEAFIKLADKIKTAFKTINSLVSEFIRILSGSKKVDTIFSGFNSDDLADSIINVIDWLNTAIDSVSGFFSQFFGVKDTIDGVSGSVGNLAGNFDALGDSTGLTFFKDKKFNLSLDNFKKMFDDIAMAIGYFALLLKDGIVKIMENVDLGKIISEVFAVLTVALSYNLIQLTKSLSRASGAIGGFFKALKNRIEGVKAIKLGGFLSVVAAIVALIAAVIALSYAIKNNEDGVAEAIGILVVISTLVGAFYVLSKKIAKEDKTFSKAVGSIATLLKSITFLMLGITVMGTVMALVEGSTIKMFTSLFIVGLIIAGVLAMMYAVQKISDQAKKSILGIGVIIAFSMALTNMCIVLALMSLLDTDKILIVAGAISMIMLALGAMVVLAKNISAGGLFAIALVLGSVLSIGFTLWALSNVPWDQIASNIIVPLKEVFYLLIRLFVGLLVFNKLGDGVAKVGLGIMAVCASLALIALALNMMVGYEFNAKEFWPLMGALVIVGLLLSVMTKVFQTLDKDKVKSMAGIMTILLVSLAVISGLFKILSAIPNDKLLSATWGMIVAIGALGSLLYLIANIVSKIGNQEKAIIKLTSLLFAVIALIGGVAATLAVLSSIDDTEQLLAAGGALFLAMAGVFIIVKALADLVSGEEKTIKKLAKIVLLVAAVSGILLVAALGIAMLSAVPVDNLLAATAALFAVAMTLTLMTGLLNNIASKSTPSKIEKTKSLTESLGGIAFSVVVMAGALALIGAAVPSGKLLYSVFALMAISAVAAALLYFCDKLAGQHKSQIDKLKSVVGSLIIVSASIFVLAGAVAMLGQLPTEQLFAASEAVAILSAILLMITLVFGTLSTVDKVDPNKMLMMAGAMVVVSIAVIALAVACRMVEKLDWKSVAANIGIIVGALALLMGIAGVSGHFIEDVAAGIIAIAAIVGVVALMGVAAMAVAKGLEMLIPQLQNFINLDMQYLMANSAMLFGASIMFALASVLMLSATPGMVLFGLACMALGKGLDMLNSPLKEFAAIPFLDLAAGVFKLIVLAGGLAIASMALGLATPGLVLFAGGLAIVTASLNAFISVAEKAANVIDTFKGLFGKTKDAGKELAGSLKEGIEEGLTEDGGFSEKTKGLGGSIIKGIFGSLTSDKPKNGKDAGKSLGKGFLGGLMDGLIGESGGMEAAAASLGDSFTKGLTENMDLSKMFDASSFDMSKMMGGDPSMMLGDLSGSMNFGDVFDQSSFDLSGKIGENFGLSQEELTITPIIDVDAQKGSMLDKFTNIFQNGEGKVSVDGTVDAIVKDQKDYTSNLNSVKNELGNLRKDVTNLGTRIGNMKLYLDGKTLVGGITPGVASNLARYTIRQNNQSGNTKRTTYKAASR